MLLQSPAAPSFWPQFSLPSTRGQTEEEESEL